MNPYKILGIPEDASQADVIKAWRKKSQEAHPDRAGGDASAFHEVQEAYKLLETPEARQAYDSGITIKTRADIDDVILRSMKAALDESHVRDILPRLLRFITNEKASHLSKINYYQKLIKDLDRNKSRVKPSEGTARNLYEQAVAAKIEASREEVRAANDAIDLLDKVKAELTGYSEDPYVYDVDTGDTRTTFTLLGTPGSGSGSLGNTTYV